MRNEFLYKERQLEAATRIRLASTVGRLLRLQARIHDLARLNIKSDALNRSLQELESAYRVLNDLWEMRLAMIESMIAVREVVQRSEGAETSDITASTQGLRCTRC